MFFSIKWHQCYVHHDFFCLIQPTTRSNQRWSEVAIWCWSDGCQWKQRVSEWDSNGFWYSDEPRPAFAGTSALDWRLQQSLCSSDNGMLLSLSRELQLSCKLPITALPWDCVQRRIQEFSLEGHFVSYSPVCLPHLLPIDWCILIEWLKWKGNNNTHLFIHIYTTSQFLPW